MSVLRRPMADCSLISTHEDITEREQLNDRLTQQNELLKQREQELKARNEQFDAAMGNMLQGLAMYDSELRLVMCNKRYAELYALAPEQVRPGTSMREILAHRVARGEFLGKNADELPKRGSSALPGTSRRST